MSNVEDKLNQIEKSFKSSEKEAEILIKDNSEEENLIWSSQAKNEWISRRCNS